MYRRHSLDCSRKPSTQASLELERLAAEASEVLKSFLPAEGNIFQKYYRQSYHEKLYEIRFSLGIYEDQFHYDEFFVSGTTNM